MYKNQRSAQRVSSTLPIKLIFGSQITLQGQLKDISSKSAFIIVKSSIHMAPHDDLGFIIENIPNIKGTIEGSATISRVVPGEGIAIYFTKTDDTSTALIQQLVDLGLLTKMEGNS